MKNYTLKNYLKLLTKYSKSNDYVLEFRGKGTGNIYKFEINKNHSKLVISKLEEELLLTYVSDIEDTWLPDKEFEPVFLEEIKYKKDGSIFERNMKYEPSEIQLTIMLFNQMDKRAGFKFKYENKTYKCSYIEGKTLMVYETEEEYLVYGTNLNQLNKHFKDYEILYIWEPIKTLFYKSFLDEQELIAKCKNKKYRLVRMTDKEAIPC